VPDLIARDGTRLAFHVAGEGGPLVCLAGGPMLASAYLGDLGGLTEHLQVIRLDLRGTGESDTPADLASCRCDRQVDDLETLRAHLGLERLDLLAHSAGANLALAYAVRHPERVGRLVLVTPSTMGVGITATDEVRREVVLRRRAEPLFDQVSTALASIASGHFTEDDVDAIQPFTYGRWDSAAQRHHAAMEQGRDPDLSGAYVADGAFDPAATRAALATFDVPVLLLAGELDLSAPAAVMPEYAGLFPDATLVVQAGAGHYPWLDDPAAFTETVATFLG
jgi:proline iminopeptidase